MTRGRRPQLNPQKIVEAALEVGINDFSMHGVAKVLGVSTTALYRHVANKDALLAMLMDEFCDKITLPKTRQWDLFMFQLAEEMREVMQALPGAADYGLYMGPATPKAFRIVNHAMGILKEAGFYQPDAWVLYGNVISSAFTYVQRHEHMQRMEALHGPGGYRILQLGADDLTELEHLAWVIDAIRKPDTLALHHRGIEATLNGFREILAQG